MVLIPSQRDPLCLPVLYKVSFQEIMFGEERKQDCYADKTLDPAGFSQLRSVFPSPLFCFELWLKMAVLILIPTPTPHHCLEMAGACSHFLTLLLTPLPSLKHVMGKPAIPQLGSECLPLNKPCFLCFSSLCSCLPTKAIFLLGKK